VLVLCVRAQVLYSAVMVPWSISFQLHDSCDAPGAAHDGCASNTLKARARGGACVRSGGTPAR
jgi:hypothetical protein